MQYKSIIYNQTTIIFNDFFLHAKKTLPPLEKCPETIPVSTARVVELPDPTKVSSKLNHKYTGK